MRAKRVQALATADAQRTVIEAIEDRLIGEGFSRGFIELLVLVYGAKGAARGLLLRQAKADGERAATLESLARSEVGTHAKVHAVLGYPRRVYPGLDDGTARSKRPRRSNLDSWTSPPCESVENCDSDVREVREHARFCVWLKKEAVAARARRPSLERDLTTSEYAQWLTHKGAIVHLLRDLGFSLSEIAIFIRIRIDGANAPVTNVASATHAASQALAEFTSEMRGGQSPITDTSATKGTAMSSGDGSHQFRRSRRKN